MVSRRYIIAPIAEAQLIQPLRRVDLTQGNGGNELIFAFFEGQANVWHHLLDNLAQQGR